MKNLFKYAIRSAVAMLFITTLACGNGCATQSSSNTDTKSPVSALQTAASESTSAFDDDPLPDVTPEPNEKMLLRLAIISDLNGRYGSDEYDDEVNRAIDMIIADHPDIVINAGDMVAGQKPKLDYKKMWSSFHENVTNRFLEAKIPMAQVPGNHDGSAYPKYENERAIYIDEWTTHRPDLDYVNDEQYPLNYSFTINDVFFIALDTTKLEPLPDEQLAWLEEQLQNNPTKHGAVIFIHVPLFPITTIKPTETLRDDRLADLFSQYGVQLVISGHQHAYFPAKYKGVTYLHAGALGGGPRPIRQNDGIAPKTLTFINLYANSSPYIDTHIINGENGQHFNHNLLPTYIVFGNGILPRIDISLDDAEFAREYMISPHMSRAQMLTLIEALRANDGDWARIPNWTKDE